MRDPVRCLTVEGRPVLCRSVASLAGFLVAFILAGAGWAGSGDDAGGAPVSAIRERWGIEVVRLGLSAMDRLVDFRYRVVDPDKATAFVDRGVKVYLIDEASGAVLSVPRPAKVGPLRTTAESPVINRVYFMLFGNPGVVQRGAGVTLVVGDSRIEHLIVE